MIFRLFKLSFIIADVTAAFAAVLRLECNCIFRSARVLFTIAVVCSEVGVVVYGPSVSKIKFN